MSIFVKKTLKLIAKHHHENHGLAYRIFFGALLFPVIICYSAVHAIHLLLFSPYRSFNFEAKQHANGTYRHSYAKHLRYKKGARAYAVALAFAIICLVYIADLSTITFSRSPWFTREAQAASRTWDGGGANDNWSDCDNWTDNTCPGSSDLAVFDGTSTDPSYINADFAGSVGGIDINTGYTNTITVQRSLTIGSQAFAQDAGIFDCTDETITLYAAGFTKTTGTFTAGTSTVKFTGSTSNYDVSSPETFNAVEIAKDASTALTITSGDTLIVGDSLTLTEGYVHTGIIDTRKNTSQSADFDGGTATLDFGDDGVVQAYTTAGGTGPKIEFDDPDDANDSVVLSTTDASLYGLNITADFGANAVLFNYNAHNLTIKSSGYTQAQGTFTAPSTLTLSSAAFTKTGGLFTEGTGATIFTGSTADYNVDATETFYDVQIYKTGGAAVSMNSDIMVVGHTLTLTDGTMNSGTIDARGDITQSADFDYGTATLGFGNDLGQTYTANGGYGPLVEFNAAADAADAVSLNADVVFYGINITSDFGDNNVPFNYNNNNITVRQGGFTQAQGTFTAPAIFTLNISNFTKSGGTFVEGLGTVIFSGNLSGVTPYDVATTETFYNVQINRGNGIEMSLSSDYLLTTGTLTLTNGAVSSGTLEPQRNVTVASTYDGGSATLKFTGENTQTFDLTGATELYNGDITINKTGGAVNLATALVMDYANQDLTIQQGTFDLSSFDLTVQGSGTETIVVNNTGNLQLQGGETITPDSVSYPQLDAGSTVTYDGSGSYAMKDYTYSNLVTAGSGVYTLGATETINNVTITSGTLSLGGNGLTVSTTFSNDATLRLRGNEATTITMDTNTGTVEFTGDDDDLEDTYTLTTLSNTYNNLTISSSDGATDIYQLGAALDINNDLNISAGTFNVTAGNFDLTVGENFANTGTFNASSGRVIFDDSAKTSIISGSTTFSGFRCVTQDKQINFTQAVTQYITGLLTLTGITDHEVVLRSTSDTNHWNLNFSGTQSVSYVDVMDSDANFGSTIYATATSLNSGNNHNWNFTNPTVAWTTAAVSKAENEVSYAVTASLSMATSLDVTVPYTVSGTAIGGGTDYSITASPITITAGNTTADITVTITNDTLDENDETVIVTMGTPTNATQGVIIEHTGTITDNDDPPTVAFTSASQSGAENIGTMTITAQLSTASSFNVTVPYTMSGTATGSGTDYSITASPITITAGNTTADITITITNDTLDENDETVIVTMGVPTNATQGVIIEHTATITDNDDPPTVAFTSASQSGAENVGTITITAQLSAVSGLNVTVPYTMSGTATGSGTDYSITASPITITAGNTTANITITVINDTLDESDETVIVTMGSPTNATQGAIIEHTGTITDNDDQPTVAFTSASQSGAENIGTMTITAQLSVVSGLNITVPYTLSGAATGDGTDYSITASPITITAGNTTADIVINVVDDLEIEDDETVIVTMTNPTNATLGAIIEHTATIIENENHPPTFSGSLPNVSFMAGDTVSNVFDLDDYFSDQEDATLTYATTGSVNVQITFTSGQVSMTSLETYSGSEEVRFVGTDSGLLSANSNAVVVSVSEAEEEGEVAYATGTNRGKGIIRLFTKDNIQLARWKSFLEGGVVPRLAKIKKQLYVFAVKKRAGSTMHVYNTNGKILSKKHLSPKLHWRKIAVGNLNNTKNTEEIAVASQRGSSIYLKVFSFNKHKNKFRLIARSMYRDVLRKYRLEIQNKNVLVILNKLGKVVYRWQPL